MSKKRGVIGVNTDKHQGGLYKEVVRDKKERAKMLAEECAECASVRQPSTIFPSSFSVSLPSLSSPSRIPSRADDPSDGAVLRPRGQAHPRRLQLRPQDREEGRREGEALP